MMTVKESDTIQRGPAARAARRPRNLALGAAALLGAASACTWLIPHRPLSPEAKAESAAFVKAYENALDASGRHASSAQELLALYTPASWCEDAGQGATDDDDLPLYELRDDTNPSGHVPEPVLKFKTSRGVKTEHQMKQECHQIASKLAAESVAGCGTKFLLLRDQIRGDGKWSSPDVLQPADGWQPVSCAAVDKAVALHHPAPDAAMIRDACGSDTAAIYENDWATYHVNALGVVVSRISRVHCYARRKTRSDWALIATPPPHRAPL